MQSLFLVCLSNIKGFNAFDSPFSFFLPINLWWEILYWKDLIEVVVNGFFLLGFVLKFVFNHFFLLLLLVLFCVTIYLHCCFVVLLFLCLVWFGFFLFSLLLFLCIGVPSCRCFAMLLLFCCGSPSPIFIVATF